MSNNIPPLLSSTPPPLEDHSGAICNDDDDDDDFGDFSNFASVSAISSSTSVADSTFQPIDKPFSEPFSACMPGAIDNSLDINDSSSFDSAVTGNPTESVHTGVMYTTLAEDNSVVAEKARVQVSEDISDVAADSRDVSSHHSDDAATSEFTFVPDSFSFNSDKHAECIHASEHTHQLEEHSKVTSDKETCCLPSEEQNAMEIKLTGDDTDSEKDDVRPSAGEIVSEIDESTSIASDVKSFEEEVVMSTSQTGPLTEVPKEDGGGSLSVEEKITSADEDTDSADDFGSFEEHTGSNSQSASEDASAQDELYVCYASDISTVYATDQRDVLPARSEPSVAPSLEADVAESPRVMSDENEVDTSELAIETNVAEKEAVITVPSELLNDQEANQIEEGLDDDFDDFEAFVTAKDSSSDQHLASDSGTFAWTAFGDTSAADAHGDDWAAFQDSELTSFVPEQQVSSGSVGIELSQKPATTMYSSIPSKELLRQSLSVCFQPCSSLQRDVEISTLYNVLETAENCNLNQKTEHGVAVWNGLRIMEQTPALKYQWTQSRANDLLLHAVNIDPRNLLNPPKKSAPVFAPNIGLLEPQKAVPDQVPALSASPALGSSGNAPFPEPLWQRQSETAMSKRRADAKRQERELLEVLELPDSGVTPSSKSHLTPLDSILKAITLTSSSSTPGSAAMTHKSDVAKEPLSAEAAAVLSRLPDLSFMHSKVLMFPVSDCAN